MSPNTSISLTSDREFDDGLLPQIGAVFYEDDFSGFPASPDAGNYLISDSEVI
jgi:hypothetical protein